MAKPLFTDNEWTFELLDSVEKHIAEIAYEELHLDVYPNQIEIIGSDQMLDAYSSHGMPLMYNHWSFGKHFLRDLYNYRKGFSGLAYEIVINSNPCISYLMEENSMTMQTLVIAHAAYGHNHFFKNNYLFRQWTDAEGIVDYLSFAKRYIAECEERYGLDAVERTLDACHAIMDYGVDRYKRPRKPNKRAEQAQQSAREEYVQQQANLLWSTLPEKSKSVITDTKDRFPREPQENIMYFIEKHSPSLESWQREIMRIVRKLAQYFYPQRQTKVMNEGWASFCHYYIMNRLWEKGLITDGHYMEFIHSHSSVLMQLPYDSKHYHGFNPYALGFDIFTDIRRMCELPTDEDREYFPHIAGGDWLETCLSAVRDYRDESFIAQFLSPAVMRKWRLFEITDEKASTDYVISGIHDRRGYDRIRQSLSRQYSMNYHHPDIQIVDANLKSNRRLDLAYRSNNGARLDESKHQVIAHLRYLWGHDVVLQEFGTY